jgi:allantoin racemase
MKLWLQSCTDMGNNPIWDEYEKSLRRHLQRVARPGTEINLQGTRVFSGRTRLYQYDVYLHTAELIEKAILAEKQGYDAYVQVGMQDYGYFEIKEVTGMPVIFPVENALRVASLVAPKIAFLTYSSVMLDRLNEKARRYGYGDRLTAGASVELTPRELSEAFRNPAPVIALLEAQAGKIAQQGAHMMITAGNPITMLLIDNGRTELAGVRVLDSQGTLVKMAEFMVDLHQMGITRDKMGEFAPQPREILAMTRKLYGVE